jgi:uncharacterized protein with NRDE domain
MCLVVLAYKKWEGYPIVILANRDEFFERPAKKAEYWEEAPEILAGRDLTSFGTWLGVTKHGRISLVTNRRDMREPKLPNPMSRGKLVEGFLKSKLEPANYEKSLQADLQKYEGFNLFFTDLRSAFCVSNRGNGSIEIEPGFHTLSNAFWNTKWPKTERILSEFQTIATRERGKNQALPIEAFFALLDDKVQAETDLLPDTGIGLERERLLSSIRISLPGYGTRVSTILAINEEGQVQFFEKTFETPFAVDGQIANYQFQIES